MLRRRGELLLSHLGDVPPRAESVTLTDWEGNTLEIALDPRLSPSHNADRYFRRYRRRPSGRRLENQAGTRFTACGRLRGWPSNHSPRTARSGRSQ